MKRPRRGVPVLASVLGVATLTLVLAATIGSMIFTLPDRNGITRSEALTAPTDGHLAAAILPRTAAHPDQSGVALLANGRTAYATRILLARAAQQSIDAQYYIWQKDLTGTLLLDALRNAADRGVRVRLLLDDNGVRNMDPTIAALHAHPNIHVRLFNPFVLRQPKALNFLFDFARLNRRMHNKSFTVDNLATVVGGRNIGDEYFGAGANPMFVDLDMLAVGDVVPTVSHDFDRYWNSRAAYPADRIITGQTPHATVLDDAVERFSGQPHAKAFRESLRTSTAVARLLSGRLPLDWARVRLISDDPAKALGDASRDELMFSRLTEIISGPRSRLDLVSAYFVPGERGVESIRAMAARGIDVNVFTNSLQATDVAAVHAGYAKYRKRLLAAGVRLFELKPEAPGERRPEAPGLAGSSSTSLHAKVFAVDGASMYVGSFNFDPRSMFLNTEMGFVVDSPPLARRLHEGLADNAPFRTYRPVLREGDVVWWEQQAGTRRLHREEPGSSRLQRLIIRIIGRLPVQWLL